MSEVRHYFRKFVGFSVCSLIAGLILNLGGCQPKEVTSARIYIQENNWGAAIEQLERAVEAYPKNSEAHYLLGVAYGQRGRYKDMNRHFDLSLKNSHKFEADIIATREGFWISKFDGGIKALENEDYDRAEDLLKQAIIIDAQKLETYKKLAIVFIKTQNFDKAITLYKKLLEEGNQDLEVLISLGNLYYSVNNFELAARILEKVVAIAPGHQDALANLALCYDALGQSEAAFTAFQNAVKANPQDKDLIFLFGVHQFQQKNYQKAIALFKRVLQLNPDDFEARVNVAVAYLSIAELEKGKLKKINLSEKHSPEDIQRLKESAILNYESAIPYLEEALEKQPNLPKLWMNLGVAYINSGEKEKGEKALLRSEELKVNLVK